MERFSQLLNGILLLGIITLLFSGCYYDNSEELYPSNPSGCDTTHVTYTIDVAPVLQNSCVSCHNTGNPSGGVDLTTYADQNAWADRIYARMSNASSPMPPNGLLGTCTVNKVKSWLDHGALNN